MSKRMNSILMALALAVASGTAQARNFDDGVVAFIKGDGETAYRIWKPLAEKGDAEAQYHLGYLFQTGTGVKPNKIKAHYWYDKAANSGHRKAFVLSKVLERKLKL